MAYRGCGGFVHHSWGWVLPQPGVRDHLEVWTTPHRLRGLLFVALTMEWIQ